MADQCFYRISVKGLSLDESGRFLLLREENGMWELPGGGLEHNEGIKEALKREIREETGLEVTYVADSPKYFTTSRGYNHPYVANAIYEIKLKNLDFTPSEECQELRYFTAEEAKKINLFPNVESFIKVFDAKKLI